MDQLVPRVRTCLLKVLRRLQLDNPLAWEIKEVEYMLNEIDNKLKTEQLEDGSNAKEHWLDKKKPKTF